MFYTDNGIRNTGYTLVIIEIVGRNHAPEFPDCDTYSNIARAPETTSDAFVIKVCFFSTQTYLPKCLINYQVY